MRIQAAVIALGLLASPLAAMATDPEPGDVKTKIETGTTIPADQQRQLTIVVKKVDRANHKVLFEATVAPEATMSGAPIRLDQLQEGDEVQASFDPKTGNIIAVERLKKAAPETAPAK